jgi:DNA ligase (NAD+)
LDTTIAATRGLKMICFTVLGAPAHITQVEGRAYLQRVGFDVGEDRYFSTCSTEEQIDAAVDNVEGARDDMPFDIDGVVIKINNLRQREILGSTISSPRWARALKFDPEQVETRVISISVQVGRTGQVTPVAELEPVALAGSTVLILALSIALRDSFIQCL